MTAPFQFLARLALAVFVAASGAVVSELTQGQGSRPRGESYEGPGTRDLPFNADQFFVPRWRLTNGPQVREAFREVVEPVVPSVVRIVCEERDVAFGAALRTDGWILTKFTSLKGPATCVLADERELPAALVGFDNEYDLALLRVETNDLVPVRFARTSPLVGSWAATVGLWRDPVAVGIVSVPPRALPRQAGVLGVELDQFNAPIVTKVRPDTGADKAGVRVGDRIVAVSGEATPTRVELIRRVRSFSPGDEVELEILRDGQRITLVAVLKSESSLQTSGSRGDTASMTGGPLSERRFGFPRALQHDTVLRPSECGGPLVNLDGETIGLNIARSGRTESYAIDAATVQQVAQRLLAAAGVAQPAGSTAATVGAPASEP
ncbi:MAG: PDZ domain-containing protein [Pirellulales bacterium]|nr:PDZ domain-containing protein [Pirellulales bacterium]